MDYTLKPAEIIEVEDIFRLYERRVRWMDDHGVRQWNTTGYLDRYPISYYMEQCRLGTLYSFRSTEEDILVGAVVLLPDDERWLDKADVPAYYVHNLVSNPDVKGLGTRILAEAERIAIGHGKHFIRLDCAADNPFLNEYYASKGYKEAGLCVDGPYEGILREKHLPAT